MEEDGLAEAAEAVLSTTEMALENQRIGSLQLRVAALCALVQICDGYDVNAIGVSVPSLTHAWNLPGPAFTQAFLWSSIGIMVGALSAGPIGDRLGRRPLLIGSLTIFGLASLLTAFAGSLLVLSILRFFTGIGIGRLGGIAAAPLGGFLLARGLPPTQIFLSACFFALVAATATALLVLRGRPSAHLADSSVAAGQV